MQMAYGDKSLFDNLFSFIIENFDFIIGLATE